MSTVFPPAPRDDDDDDDHPTVPVATVVHTSNIPDNAQDLLPLAELMADDVLRTPGMPKAEAIALFEVARKRFPTGSVVGLSVEALRARLTGDPARDAAASVYVVSGFSPILAARRRVPLSDTFFQLIAYDDLDVIANRLEHVADELPFPA